VKRAEKAKEKYSIVLGSYNNKPSNLPILVAYRVTRMLTIVQKFINQLSLYTNLKNELPRGNSVKQNYSHFTTNYSEFQIYQTFKPLKHYRIKKGIVIFVNTRVFQCG
jgi:mannosyltransferase OCH1-like enzyme